MKLQNIMNIIEENYPLALAYEWDNPGLILGRKEQNVKKCVVTLDVTEEILNQAIKENADLIISHHPIIFSGIKKINSDDKIGEILLKAAENKIALYAAHTNMDTAQNGINTKLAEMFSLKDAEIIEPNSDFQGCGLGIAGKIFPISLAEFLIFVKKILNAEFIRYSGLESQIISSVAIGSGSCSELIPHAIKMGMDTIITGDLKYHTALDYSNKHFSVIDAGHFLTEQIVRDMFIDILKGTDIEIIKSTQKDIFKII